MPSLIQRAKACYQFTKTRAPEAWARSLYPYRLDDAISLARLKLGNRLSDASRRFNFIMAVPIVNWEPTLVEHARAYGSCHHINFEARGFFESEGEWQVYRRANFAKLKSAFETAYSEGDINVLFLYLSEFHIDPDCLVKLQIKNVIVVQFNWDDRLHYNSRHKGQSVGVKRIAKIVDLNLTMAAGPMNRYVADNAPVFYWWGKNEPTLEEPTLPQIEFNRVLFFGSRYGYREELIEHLLRKKYSIGCSWRRLGN